MVFVFAFIFIPHPAEYGAEESSPDAVPMLGLVRIGFGREGYLGGDVSLPGYGPLRSDAILWYVQIVYHSSTLYSCIWGGVFGIDCAGDLVSGQLNGPCLIDLRNRSYG